MNDKLNICICGGGNLGSVCAGVFLHQGHKVNLLTGHPAQWNPEIKVKDVNNNFYEGFMSLISDDASRVIPDSDLVLLCVPGYLIERYLRMIKPYIKVDTIIGSIVASTGFFFLAHNILNIDQPLFGFQRVPFISRYNEYGKTAELLGYKKELLVAIENVDKDFLNPILCELFMTPIKVVNSYLEVSISNSNPILHTGRLYALWGDTEIYSLENPISFYAEWDDKSSEIVLGMDEEFMEIIKSIGLNHSSIISLKDYYQIQDKESFTEKIRNISAFKNIKAPMVKKEDGWIPDFSSRYFIEDFPYGLKFIKDLAFSNNISVPIINKVYLWGEKYIIQ